MFLGDLPHRNLPLPKALDDPDAAKFLRAAQAHPRLLITVVAEVLIRTGLRVGELCNLRADAIRTELSNDGWDVTDGPDGPTVRARGDVSR